MAISQLYPNTRPTLNLNFARSKTLDPRITFTRNSTATYVGSDGLIKTAAAGEARFDHNGNGDSLGLLIEESRTNYNFYSNDFSNAHYSCYNLTKTNTTAPDGSNDAISFGEQSASPMTINPSVSTQTFTSSTASVYVKVFGSRQYFAIREVNASNNWVRAVFDCTGEGSFQTVEGDVVTKTGFTPDIENVGNGWYRCSLNVKYSTAQQVGFYFGPSDSDTGGGATNGGYGVAVASPTANSGFVLWGYQQEAGDFPTSLIPTSGSTVTRLADTAEITGDNFSSWWDSSEGSIVTIAENFPTNSGYRKAWEFNKGGTNPSHIASGPTLVASNGSGTTFFQSPINGNYSNSTLTLGSTKFKTAFAFATGDIAGCGDGGSIQTNTSGLDPDVKRIHIGRNRSAGETLNGTISRLAYYPTRLTDSQLQELTS